MVLQMNIVDMLVMNNMSNYRTVINEEHEYVQILVDDGENDEEFLNIWSNDELTPSPFQSLDQCKEFAEIIVKMLEKEGL